MGYNKTNLHYLYMVLLYLYDEKNQGEHNNHITLEDWGEEWTCSGKSSNSPRQRNGNDCGIFTLVLLALLSQGIWLQTDSYSQDLFCPRQTRIRIAYLIWSSSIGDPQTPWLETPTAQRIFSILSKKRARAGIKTTTPCGRLRKR